MSRAQQNEKQGRVVIVYAVISEFLANAIIHKNEISCVNIQRKRQNYLFFSR